MANKHFFDSSDILLEHRKKRSEAERKSYLMVWNERVSRGKEMSTSLDTEYNGMNVTGREKREKFFDESSCRIF